MVHERISKLEEISGQDVGRNIHALVDAARGELFNAARSIADHPNPHVAILTGLYIASAPTPAAETDGPVGAVQMASAFLNAGIPAQLFIDPPSAPPLVAAHAAGANHIPLHIVERSEEAVTELVTHFKSGNTPVTHVIAIERMGPSHSGQPFSMRAFDLSEFVAPFHHIFEDTQRPWQTIAIGDGGNEMGMGKLPYALVSEHIERGEQIACRIAADHLIVSGLSNWGATALIRALSLLRPDLESALLEPLTLEREQQILQATVEHGGAVDGVLQIPQASVDSILWPQYSAVMTDILGV